MGGCRVEYEQIHAEESLHFVNQQSLRQLIEKLLTATKEAGRYMSVTTVMIWTV